MTKISYAGYRFPPEIIEQAIWLYLRLTLSFRDVEDLLAERGLVDRVEMAKAVIGALAYTRTKVVVHENDDAEVVFTTVEIEDAIGHALPRPLE